MNGSSAKGWISLSKGLFARRPRRWRFGFPLLMLMALIGAVIVQLPAANVATAAPPSSKSFYVTGYSTSWAYNRGCDLGTQDLNTSGTQRHVMVLDFGAMYLNSSGTWMVTAFSGADFSLGSARVMVQEFGHGYWVCTGSDLSSTAYAGLGTNNSAGTITSAAGKALAAQAYNAYTYLNNNYNQAFGIGADDFESWGKGSSNATAARNWIDGYNAASNRVFLVNYGSADGCPTGSVPSASSCNPGLPAETIWRVSWSGVAYPLPEIYTTTGTQAKQWRYLSLYSYLNHGSKFFFQGVMSQSGACSQSSTGCSGTDNSPSTAWSQLNTQVDADSRTATDPGAPTDIRWK